MSEWLRTDTHCLFFLPYWFGSYTYYLHSFSDYPCLIHLKTGIAQRTNSVWFHSHEWGPCVRAQSCPTLCEPVECSLPYSSVHGIFRQECWSGSPFPTPEDLPNPGIEPASSVASALQVDSLPLSHMRSPEWEGKFIETQSITMVVRSWGTGKWGVCIWWAQSFSVGRREVLGWAVAMVTHQREQS